MADDRVIGLDGKMPWHMPADLAWFKRNTLGKPVIMGRKTWESIGRSLPQRRNLVVSRDLAFQPEGVECFVSPQEALEAVYGEPEVMVIGGAQLYRHFLPNADRLYLTRIKASLSGDTFFPDYTQYHWRETCRIDFSADEKNPYSCAFLILERET